MIIRRERAGDIAASRQVQVDGLGSALVQAVVAGPFVYAAPFGRL